MSINEFKARLQGKGARPNRFRVIMPFPVGVITGDETNEMSFLCKAAALPSFILPDIIVPFQGRQLKLPGDRVIEDWAVTVINDVDFKLRNAFERWSNILNNVESNGGLEQATVYTVDAIVEQLDLNFNPVKRYVLQDIWPSEVSSIPLSFDAENQIEEFTVNFKMLQFSSDTTS